MENHSKYYKWTKEDKKKLERAYIRNRNKSETRWNDVAKDMNNPFLTAKKCRYMLKAIKKKKEEEASNIKNLCAVDKDDKQQAPSKMTKKERVELFAATRDCDPTSIDFDQLSFMLFNGKFTPAFLNEYYQNYLSASIVHGIWNTEDTQRLMCYVATQEEKNEKIDWKFIGSKMNRTKEQCKSRFSYVKKKL